MEVAYFNSQAHHPFQFLVCRTVLKIHSLLQVELLIPQLQFLDEEGAQVELWELSRVFLDTLIKETGCEVSWKLFLHTRIYLKSGFIELFDTIVYLSFPRGEIKLTVMPTSYIHYITISNERNLLNLNMASKLLKCTIVYFTHSLYNIYW